MESPFKILLADDHVMFRRGVRSLIQGMDNVEVVGEASDGLELLRLLKEISPHLVIMDISMPNLRGLEATREIKILDPGVKVLILTMHKDREYLYHALTAGAEGYLLKEDADGELISAIETLRKGGTFISPLLSAQMADIFVEKFRPGGESPKAPEEPAYRPGTGNHQAHRRRQIQQGDRRTALYQQPDGAAPPRQHHEKIEPQENRRPG